MSTQPEQQPRRSPLAGLNPKDLLAAGLSESAAPEALPQVPGYEIRGLIGTGGMGAVYEAHQKSLDRTVAVKLIPAAFKSDLTLLDRLEREARAMARLRHENIVQVHDFVHLEDGGAVIVMERVAGQSLHKVMDASPQGLPVERAVELAVQIANALSMAHDAGVVHRDIKPDNILVAEPGGTAKVTDFGLALEMTGKTARLTQQGTAIGTPAYMAPEQLDGSEIDARTDIYSLGKVLYEMLTGTRPGADAVPPTRVNALVPKALSDAVMRAMSARSRDRFHSATDFSAALRRSLQSSRALPRRRWLLAAAAVGVASVTPFLLRRKADWHSMLATVHLSSALKRGDWQQAGKAIESASANSPAMLAVSREDLGTSFDLRWRFTRLSGINSVALFFRAPQGTGTLEFEAWSQPGLSGLQALDGADLRQAGSFQFPLENGREYEFLTEVRPDSIKAIHEGRVLLNQPMTGRSLGVTAPWDWSGEWPQWSLALGTWNSPTRFTELSFRRV